MALRGAVEDQVRGSDAYPLLFSAIQLAGLTVRNRIAMSAMSTHMVGPGGSMTPQQIAYYRERALGGVGMVTVEYACVDTTTGMARPWQIILDSPANIPGHLFLVEAIKEAGASACIQLHHAGRQTHSRTIGGRQPIAPSAIASPYFGEAATPRAMTGEEIEALIERFAKSARWAIEAGYDAIELHAAHGYLIGQFLSPLTNHRDDEWGGDAERRLRFPQAVIAAVKAELGSKRPLLYRFSAQEFVPGGLTIEESVLAAPGLVAAGADALHVSTGIMDRMEFVVEPMSMPEGWRLPYAQQIRDAVDVPVLTVGQIRQPAVAEKALADGCADMVALGRPLLVDPYWPTKARAGRDLDIRPCTSCNWCIGPAGKHRGVGCAENPRSGRELDELQVIGEGRPAVVVGAGPGGVAAALLLSQAGFEVDLYEGRHEVGGGLIVSGTPPHKENLLVYLEYLKRRLADSRVRVHLGSRLEIAALVALKPAVAIVATGSLPLDLEVAGLDRSNVHIAFDLLLGDVDLAYAGAGPMVIYGGGETGCETAEYLARRGVEVTLVSRSPAASLARSAERLYRGQLRERLAANPHIDVVDNTTLLSVEDGHVLVRDAAGVERSLPAKAVIIAQGRAPAPLSARAIEAAGICSATIGDAVQVRRIGEAVHDAYRAVRALGPRLGSQQLAC